MRRHLAASFLLPCSIVTVVAGCDRRPTPDAPPAVASTPAVAGKAASGTDDDEVSAFMVLAFPGWKPQERTVWPVPQRDDPRASTTIRVQPRSVVRIDETHRALVTIGEWSDENGNDSGAQSDQGTAGVSFSSVALGGG